MAPPSLRIRGRRDAFSRVTLANRSTIEPMTLEDDGPCRKLLPDISGYTEFLTKTELVHSSHIINELLEAILAANRGDFVLSEVEGDALLLYHKGKPIEADALVRQCLSMFESFHTQLKIIDRDSICQ